MHDHLTDIQQWLDIGHNSIALATVVETWGSAPRRIGAKMAFTADGFISGSVSGGCVEGAVIEAGQIVLQSSVPQLLEFSVADESAWGVGLACGGRISVFVEPLDLAAFAFETTLRQAAATGAIVTVISGAADLVGKKLLYGVTGVEHSLLPAALTQEVVALISTTGVSGRLVWANEIDLFVDVVRPQPTLIIIGGAHIAVALARLAKLVGYTTVVIDPRRAFGNVTRFPDVDQLIPEWPTSALAAIDLNAESAVVTLSHDPKIDDPALRIVLDNEVFYVGSLGSRQTHAARKERLLEQGLTQQQVERIHAPVGLSIGASNPEEIALAIMAEVVQAYRLRQ